MQARGGRRSSATFFLRGHPPGSVIFEMWVDIGYGARVRADLIEAFWELVNEPDVQVEQLGLTGWGKQALPTVVIQTVNGRCYGSPFTARTIAERLVRADEKQ